MKTKDILTVLAVVVTAIAQPVLAEFIQDENGEITHVNGIPLPPMQTVEETRAQAQKEIAAANKAREAVQAANNQPATRNTSPATPPQEVFYTGKPYIEETGQYAFLFRSYDPELGRWTTADPSGFPDGANNAAYLAIPTHQFDFLGLATYTREVSNIFYYSQTGDTWTPWQAGAFTIGITTGVFTSGVSSMIGSVISSVGSLLPNTPNGLSLISSSPDDSGWSPEYPTGQFASLSVDVNSGDYFTTAWHTSETLEPGQHFFIPHDVIPESEWNEMSGRVPYPGSPGSYSTQLQVKWVSAHLTLVVE